MKCRSCGASVDLKAVCWCCTEAYCSSCLPKGDICVDCERLAEVKEVGL